MSRELWKMHQDQGDAFELLVLCGPKSENGHLRKLERGFCFNANQLFCLEHLNH